MQKSRTRRGRQGVAALGIAIALGALALPASAGSSIAPSDAQLAGITQATGAKRCIVGHDGVQYSSLQAGVDAAEAGETVTLRGTCAGFTYIDKDVTIRGVRTARSGMPTITGRRTIPLIHVAGLEVKAAGRTARPAGSEPGWNTVATIVGIRLMRGFHSSEGAIFIGDGSGLILRDAIVTRNRGTENGAIDGDYNTLLILRGTTELSYNRAIDGDGGAVDFGPDSRVEMHGQSRIHHNKSWEDGGAMYIGENSILVMNDDASIDNNRTISDDEGGAIDASSDDGGLIELNDRARIAGNRATDDGGAIYANNYTIVLNDDARIVNNVADEGGAIKMFGSALYVNDDARITANYADTGGGVYASSSSITTAGASRIGGNRAVIGRGGGVIADASTLSIGASSRITGNRAVTNGGGVVLENSSAMSIVDTARIDTNRTISGDGGGIWSDGSSIVLGGSALIELNQAKQHGGGVYLNNTDIIDIDGNGLIRNNTAGSSGGGIWAWCAATLTDVVGDTNVLTNTPDQVVQVVC